VVGRAVPLDRGDIDTDQIIPSDALKIIGRSGFGRFLFAQWREDPGFVLNLPQYQGAKILVTGPNFGCGSSREHAPWALQDYGFGAIIAPSFADIFKNNCAKIGLLAVELPPEAVQVLLEAATREPEKPVTVDLESCRVVSSAVNLPFDIDPYVRHRLLNGLDDIGVSLSHADEIAAFERRRPAHLPVVVDGNSSRPPQ